MYEASWKRGGRLNGCSYGAYGNDWLIIQCSTRHEGCMMTNNEYKKVEKRDVVYSECPPFPRNMMIEVTNACNYQCVYCGYEHMNRTRKNCDKGLILELINQAYLLGTREIGFYLIGEPLLSMELEEYIESARQLGYEYIYLTTNGVLATANRVKSLCRAGLNSLNISLSAAKEETYYTIHRAKEGDWERINRNINEISKMKESKEIELAFFISYCVCNWNKTEVDDFSRLFSDKVDRIYFDDCSVVGGVERKKCVIENGLSNTIDCAEMPCEMIFNRIHITCDGYMDACCVDINNELAVADLKHVSLYEAWTSEIMVDLRRQHLEGKLKNNMCYGCVKGKMCKSSPLNEKLCKH